MDRYARLKLKDLSVLTSAVTPTDCNTDDKDEQSFRKAGVVARKKVTRIQKM